MFEGCAHSGQTHVSPCLVQHSDMFSHTHVQSHTHADTLPCAHTHICLSGPSTGDSYRAHVPGRHSRKGRAQPSRPSEIWAASGTALCFPREISFPPSRSTSPRVSVLCPVSRTRPRGRQSRGQHGLLCSEQGNLLRRLVGFVLLPMPCCCDFFAVPPVPLVPHFPFLGCFPLTVL